MRRANLARCLLLAIACGGAAGCGAVARPSEAIHSVALADADAFARLRDAFVAANPGYDLAWHAGVRDLSPAQQDRVVFVQAVHDRAGDPQTAPTVGDVLLVRAGQDWRLPGAGAVDLLAFAVPSPLPDELPVLVRPDWDPRITDTPGGCATETGAYRRILLTWKPEVGPYVLHTLNAHRVRIDDSFSHYHPADGGFDEFYLVQMAGPQARLLTSTQVPAIEARTVTREQAPALIQTQPLRAGQLVYLPRGTMHRGLGGALVQVISVPGFVPRREIGVDHHLWAINVALGLQGDARLPFHLVAARTAVVK